MGRDMGGRFKKEGIYVYLWLIHVDVWQKTTKFCKAIILQLKNKLIKMLKTHTKNLPAMWETWVRSLGWEDPLEKGKATHSSILAWRIPWTTVHVVTKSQKWLSDFHTMTKRVIVQISKINSVFDNQPV